MTGAFCSKALRAPLAETGPAAAAGPFCSLPPLPAARLDGARGNPIINHIPEKAWREEAVL